MSYDSNARYDTPLAVKIKNEIGRNGPMTVARYMSECLWDDAHGYYATRPVIGRGGDFITSAEISQVFGELVGLWVAVVWQSVLGAPRQLQFVEYGPGRGTLMFDCLRAARVVPGFLDAVSVHLVEVSGTLAALQRQTLATMPVAISWGQGLADFQTPAIVIANEFLDSWPVDQWIKADDGWCQRGVGVDANGRLCFTIMLDAPRRRDLDAVLPGAAVGDIYESVRTELLAQALQAVAQTGPLAMLLIDYGHTLPSSGDTLQAVRGHAYESPLAAPGEADLSAHVNFYDLAVALHGAALEIDGPVTQTEFLGALGIVERASRLMNANAARAGEIETGAARIIAPNGMGSRFKAIGIRSPGLAPLPGFHPKS